MEEANTPTQRPSRKRRAKEVVETNEATLKPTSTDTTRNKYGRKSRVGEPKISKVQKVYTAGKTQLKVTQY